MLKPEDAKPANREAAIRQVKMAVGQLNYWQNRQIFSLANEPIEMEIQKAQRELVNACRLLAESEG